MSDGFLKRADIKDSHFVPLENSAFYLQTLVNENDETSGDNVTTTLKTEQMKYWKGKDLYNRVWNGFSAYTEQYESALGGESDGSFGDAAEKFKAELTNDLDAQFIDLAMSALEVDYTGDRNELSILGDTLDSDSSKFTFALGCIILLIADDTLTVMHGEILDNRLQYLNTI